MLNGVHKEPVQWAFHADPAQPSVTTADDTFLRPLHHAILLSFSDLVAVETGSSSYSANQPSASSALSHHVPRTSTDFAARDAVNLCPGPCICGPLLDASIQSVSKSKRRICFFVLAAKRLLDQQLAKLKQVCSELATCSRQLVEGVEVNVASQL